MTTESYLTDDWPLVLGVLPDNLETSARHFGALTRKRAFVRAADLVRLALAYGLGQRSLRATALWAEQTGIADVSDVAVLKRLRGCAAWLGHLLAQVLLARADARTLPALPYRLRVLDATTVQRPGSTGTDWRVHVGIDLATVQIDHIELTDATGGESLARAPVAPGDLVLGDRGLAHRRGIHAVTAAGGAVLVRFSWQNLPLQRPDGQPLDLLAALRTLDAEAIGDFAVQTAPAPKDGLPAITGRVVAWRKDATTAAAARRRLRAQARKKGKTPSAATLEAAAYVFVFTTVPADQLAAEWVLALYRFRWQIELVFKRHKSLLHLDALVAKTDALGRTFLYANLLGGLLIEELAGRFLALSPPAPRSTPTVEPLAADAGAGGQCPAGARHRPPTARVVCHRAPGPTALPRPTPSPPFPDRLDPASPSPLPEVISA